MPKRVILAEVQSRTEVEKIKSESSLLLLEKCIIQVHVCRIVTYMDTAIQVMLYTNSVSAWGMERAFVCFHKIKIKKQLMLNLSRIFCYKITLLLNWKIIICALYADRYHFWKSHDLQKKVLTELAFFNASLPPPPPPFLLLLLFFVLFLFVFSSFFPFSFVFFFYI